MFILQRPYRLCYQPMSGKFYRTLKTEIVVIGVYFKFYPIFEEIWPKIVHINRVTSTDEMTPWRRRAVKSFAGEIKCVRSDQNYS